MSAYDWGDGKLVSEFMNACARAGVSGSGLVIDFMAGSDRSDAHFLRSVLMARLSGQKPTWQSDDVMELIGDRGVSATEWWGPQVNSKQKLIVERVWFHRDGQWLLEFKGVHADRGTPLYPDERFQKLENNSIRGLLG